MIVRLPNPMSVVVWLAFLLPASLVGAGVDGLFGAAVFILGAAVLYVKPSPWEARKPSSQAIRIFLLLELLYAFSFLYSAAFNGLQTGVREFLELPRFVVLGVFVVYLIRHYDAGVRAAMEWAATAAIYVALIFPVADPQGYVAVMALCWFFFFSRLRLRYLHAATALLVVVFSGALASWTAALWIVSAAASLRLYRELRRRRARFSFRLSLGLFAALLASPIVYLRSDPAAAAARASLESVCRQFIRRSPVFGWGPIDASAIPGRSQYLFWALKGGALGAGLILAALTLVGYRLLRASKDDPARLAGAAVFLASVGLMLATGRFLESERLFFLTSFFVAGMFETSGARP
jgi:hypothetical protein